MTYIEVSHCIKGIGTNSVKYQSVYLRQWHSYISLQYFRHQKFCPRDIWFTSPKKDKLDKLWKKSYLKRLFKLRNFCWELSFFHRDAMRDSHSLNAKLSIHYNDVMMGAIASQITSLAIVYSIVYSAADHRKHQSSASPAFVRGIHRRPVNSPHKWPATRKMFSFDDVIMISHNTVDVTSPGQN